MFSLGLVSNAGSIFICVNRLQNGNLNTTSSLSPSGGGGGGGGGGKAEMTPIWKKKLYLY